MSDLIYFLPAVITIQFVPLAPAERVKPETCRQVQFVQSDNNSNTWGGGSCVNSSQQHTKCQLNKAQYQCHSELTVENGHHGDRHDQDAQEHVSDCQGHQEIVSGILQLLLQRDRQDHQDVAHDRDGDDD